MGVWIFDLKQPGSGHEGRWTHRSLEKAKAIPDRDRATRVALVLVDEVATARTLALGLAERGMNVGVVCPPSLADQLGHLPTEVERLGKALLLMPRMIAGKVNADDIVKLLHDRFGRLDVYIDCARSDVKGRWRFDTSLQNRLHSSVPIIHNLVEGSSS